MAPAVPDSAYGNPVVFGAPAIPISDAFCACCSSMVVAPLLSSSDECSFLSVDVFLGCLVGDWHLMVSSLSPAATLLSRPEFCSSRNTVVPAIGPNPINSVDDDALMRQGEGFINFNVISKMCSSYNYKLILQK